MYAIYEKNSGKLPLFEGLEDTIDLNEAEEMLHQLRKENPDEFARIADLRDGIRSARLAWEKGSYVFCQAGRYQQLFLVDKKGKVLTRDVPRILNAIKCAPHEPKRELPGGHNRVVNKVRVLFEEEVKQREAEKQYSTSLTQGQRYVIRELGVEFRKAQDEDLKGQINVLEKAFRLCRRQAVVGELNKVRKNSMVGEALIQELSNIFHRHSLGDLLGRPAGSAEEVVVPRIICSEGLL